jgi:phosphoglucosamine mutase
MVVEERNLFGTDGIRGVANKELTWEMAFRLGRAMGKYLSPGKDLCVGKDTRISGDMLHSSIVAGITSAGRNVVDLGIITTPGLSFIIKHENLGGGVMISASHNPAKYNGLKVFGPDGKKIPDELEIRFSGFILGKETYDHYPTGSDIGRVISGDLLVDGYVDFLCSVPRNDLRGVRVAIDAANGAASFIAERVWQRLSGSAEVFYNSPDGININEGCGSTHAEVLSAKISQSGKKYVAGFAYDGDGDRCIGVDEEGKVLDGDHIMAIAALHMKKEGTLAKDTVVGTVMTNLGLEKCLQSHGISLVRTQVGDRFVLERMDEEGFNLGGEQSGHIIFRDIHTTGDGILTSIIVSDIMVSSGKRLSELGSVMQDIPQVLHNIEAKEPKKVANSQAVIDAVKKAQADLGARGRVLVRPSGTEPLVRIMVEADDSTLVASCIDYLAKVIEKVALEG